MRWQFTDKALFFAPWNALLMLKAGSLEEYGLLERWGEPGRAPAILLLESSFQSARWLVEASSSFVLSCEPLEIEHWNAPPGLRPGERFCVFLRGTERREAHIVFSLHQRRLMPGDAPPGLDFWQNSGEPDGRIGCSLVPLNERDRPADRACLWREVYA